MLPGPDDIEELVTGALGVRDLTLPDELVILAQLVLLHAELQQLHRRGDLLLGRALVAEVTDEGDADATVVVIVRVGAGHVPAAALVDVAVAAHQEVVAHVDPALGLDVERLYDAHVQLALGLIVAGLRRCVADDGVGGRLDLQPTRRVRRLLGAPVGSRHYAHAALRWLVAEVVDCCSGVSCIENLRLVTFYKARRFPTRNLVVILFIAIA